MTMGQKIRDLRKQMGLSQEVLGEILHVSRQAITKWETDVGVPDVSNLSELAKLFGVPVDYFLTELNNNEVTTQLNIDITDYRKNNESDISIIRHFYSQEWYAYYTSYYPYPKNKLIRNILFILFWLSNTFGDAIILGQIFYKLEKMDEMYYLLYKDNLVFLAHINNDKLIVENITNKMKYHNGCKGIVVNTKTHFSYDNKMFSLYTSIRPESTSKEVKKWAGSLVLFIVITALIIGVILGLMYLSIKYGW